MNCRQNTGCLSIKQERSVTVGNNYLFYGVTDNVRKAGFGKVLIRHVLFDVASVLAYHSQLDALLPLLVIVAVEESHITRKVHKKIRGDRK